MLLKIQSFGVNDHKKKIQIFFYYLTILYYPQISFCTQKLSLHLQFNKKKQAIQFKTKNSIRKNFYT